MFLKLSVTHFFTSIYKQKVNICLSKHVNQNILTLQNAHFFIFSLHIYLHTLLFCHEKYIPVLFLYFEKIIGIKWIESISKKIAIEILRLRCKTYVVMENWPNVLVFSVGSQEDLTKLVPNNTGESLGFRVRGYIKGIFVLYPPPQSLQGYIVILTSFCPFVCPHL